MVDEYLVENSETVDLFVGGCAVEVDVRIIGSSVVAKV